MQNGKLYTKYQFLTIFDNEVEFFDRQKFFYHDLSTVLGITFYIKLIYFFQF